MEPQRLQSEELGRATRSNHSLTKLFLMQNPEVRLLSDWEREMSKVSEPMKQIFRQLVTGVGRWPLYLFGAPGVGKTSACLALLDYIPSGVRVGKKSGKIVDFGPGGLYDTAEWIVKRLLKGDIGDKMIKGAPLAVLDELGQREKCGDAQYSAVKDFADLRRGKPTIYISNLAPDQIPTAYDDRIASRILCGTRFELTGEDRRFA